MCKVGKCGFIMLMATFLFIITGCGPHSKMIKDYSITEDLSGLKLDKSIAPTMLYKRPGAPSLAAYNRFIVDPVQVNYSDPKMKELDPEQVGKMQQYFRDAIIKELHEAGYEVGTRSQPNTMRISLTISGLKAPSSALNVATTAAGAAVGVPVAIFSIAVGEVTVKAVFRESLTNRIDAVVVDRSQGSRWLKSKAWSTWADVEGTFDKWAKGIREAIENAHGR